MHYTLINSTYKNSSELKEIVHEKLTRQEIKILKSAILDYSNKQIASQLGISESTVKVHKRSICKKFGIVGQIAFRKFLRWIDKYL
jgi:two-component system nitrate/nitrite response regulator NarP